MPYEAKGKCIFKKDGGAKVGCTKGSVKKYLAALHANADESLETNKQTIEEMKGGLSDGMTPAEIAKKHGITLSKINHQIILGKKVEMEHTDDSSTAKEIAMDHLVEIPDYYTRLAKMEKSANRTLDKKETTENTKDLIKRLIRENIGLYLKDETPETTTYDILVHQKPIGTIVVGQIAKNFGKDTLEILVIVFKKGVNHLQAAKETIITLFETYPDINRLVMQPKPESRDFWFKLDGQRVDSKYMIILRGH